MCGQRLAQDGAGFAEVSLRPQDAAEQAEAVAGRELIAERAEPLQARLCLLACSFGPGKRPLARLRRADG